MVGGAVEADSGPEVRVSDPVHIELVKNALSTLADEMGLAIVRSAYSSQVKEAGDSTAAIFDRRGRLLAQSGRAPLMHLASLRPGLGEVVLDFGIESMREGDVFACNDPYRGGIHSNDIMVFRPCFIEGELEFFTAALMHVADVGGMAAGGLPANATEMYHEGLILPPVRLYAGGEPEAGLLAVIAANSRTPAKVLGDLRAMVAGAFMGARRLVELTERYGLQRLRALVEELLQYTDRRMRLDIAALPNGSHEGSFVVDDDGIDIGKGHTVRVRVTIDGERIKADFTGTDPQAKGPINAAFSQALSGVLFVVRSLLSPDIPVNDGLFWSIEVNFPQGSLCNPNPPAACNARMATVMAVIEAMLGALSEIVPEARVAASSNVHVSTLSGVEPGTGRVWAAVDPQFGGGGARGDRDGDDDSGLDDHGGQCAALRRGLRNGVPAALRAIRGVERFRRPRSLAWRTGQSPGRALPGGRCFHRSGHGPLPDPAPRRRRRSARSRGRVGSQRGRGRRTDPAGEDHLAAGRSGGCHHHAHLLGWRVRCARRSRPVAGPGRRQGGKRHHRIGTRRLPGLDRPRHLDYSRRRNRRASEPTVVTGSVRQYS